MRRTYITAVKPLDNYILQVDFKNGSRLYLNLAGKLKSLRFKPLGNPQIWESARTDGVFVFFGSTEISHDEILTLAEEV